jgi:colanic acid/amylovoran biosynthesis glycosyltransferase
VDKLKANVCVTIPSPISYSETFLQAHVDRLSTVVSYLGDFPVDINEIFPREISSGKTEQLKRQVRVCLHGAVLNPLKRASLRRFFKKEKIVVLLAEYGLTGAGVLSVCKELRMPLIVHFHGYDAYSTEVLHRHAAAYKRVFEYASAIIAVSKHMEEQLVRLGAPKERVIYNPYGVDPEKFAQAEVLTSPPRVLAVGRFVEKKAPYLTILAFGKVVTRLPEARLVMVGAGLLHDVCSKLIKALHLEHAVELKGAVDHETVAALMQQSRVFAQHSVTPISGDTEGMPLAILEAGAAGLPVVSTRHAGISEVVIHGKTGFLVDEGDVEAMAEHLYQLLASAERASELGKNARDHISANFSMERSIEKLRNIAELCTLHQSMNARDPATDHVVAIS